VTFNKSNAKAVAIFGAALAICLASARAKEVSQEPQQKMYSLEDVKWMFQQVEKLDPTKKELLENLRRLAPGRREYTAKEINTVLGTLPKIKASYGPPYPEVPSRNGAISKPDAVRLLKMFNSLSPKKTKAQIIAELESEFKNKSKEDVIRALAETKEAASDPEGDLVAKFGNKADYFPSEVRDVQTNGPKSAMEEAPVSIPAPTGVWEPIKYGILHPLIRKSWSDVLLSEDLSQNASKSKIGDLVGATFSYSDETRSHTETWNAVGALILPFDYKFADLSGLKPTELLFAPSISVNRISTNPPSKTDIDQLLHRLGLFVDWEEGFGAIQLRGAFVYGTDTEYRTSMPAFEFDLEPQVLWSSSNARETGVPSPATKYFKIGYQNILIHKTPQFKEETDNSFLDYQLRFYLHAEGGDLQRSAAVFNTVDGSFFRMGPATQLRVNAPRLVFDRPLSFTATYSYLPAISGNPANDHLLTLDLTLGLIRLNPPSSTSLQQKLSLNANYTDGGLDFTKQEVRQFTLGLSVLF
jgi:hypothetical protein